MASLVDFAQSLDTLASEIDRYVLLGEPWARTDLSVVLRRTALEVRAAIDRILMQVEKTVKEGTTCEFI